MFPAVDDYLIRKNLFYQMIIKVMVDHMNCLHTQF